jgi:hypothetical protein
VRPVSLSACAFAASASGNAPAIFHAEQADDRVDIGVGADHGGAVGDRELLRARGEQIPDDITSADLVTNQFIDPAIGLQAPESDRSVPGHGTPGAAGDPGATLMRGAVVASLR